MRTHLNRALLAVIALLFLIACEGWTEYDTAEVMDLVEAWAHAKEINPVKQDGSLNPRGVVNLGERMLTGRSGEEEADAATEAMTVLETVYEADKLIEQGRAERNQEKMMQAIRMRPEDWTYMTAYAALLLEKGQVQEHDTVFLEAQLHQQQSHADALWVANQTIGEYSIVEMKYLEERFLSKEQCVELYTQLASAYGIRYRLANSITDRELRDRAIRLGRSCH